MSSQDMQEEIRKTGERLLQKLKQIPQADTVEIISFSIILIFIGVVLLMGVVACAHCCCVGKRRRRAARVEPKP